MQRSDEENQRWENLIADLENYSVMWDFNKYVAGVPRGIVTCGMSRVMKPDHQSLKIWLSITRNQYPNILVGIGQVLQYHRSDAEMVLQAIRKHGFAFAFGLEGHSAPVIHQPQPQPSKWKNPTVVEFFRTGSCRVDSTIEDATVIREIEKVSNSLILRAVKSPEVSVMKWLEKYPNGCFLVLLAMIREGVCSPVTAVKTKAMTIIQYQDSEESVCDLSITGLINVVKLPRLALFLRDPEEDDFHWPLLFSGIKPSVLRNLLVKYGKKEIEVKDWNAEKLVDVIKTFSPTIGNNVAFKVEIIELFRANGTARDAFPWLSTKELTKWLTPVELFEEEAIHFIPTTPKPKLSRLGRLLEANQMSNPGTTAFVHAYEEAGYEYEDLETMLTELNNPNTAGILKHLTDPQRMKLLRVWRSAK